MAVGGVPIFQRDHTVRVARFAVEAIEAASRTLIDTRNPEMGFIKIRAGFNTGPAVASVGAAAPARALTRAANAVTSTTAVHQTCNTP